MNLLYKSTRDAEKTVTASQAILKGLADDGGLFVPVSIPKLPVSLGELKEMTYQEIAYTVMKEFLTDFTEEELKSCIAKAYDSKFDTEEIAPLVKADGAYYLELFHGSTIAFKDMALSILPHLMTVSAECSFQHPPQSHFGKVLHLHRRLTAGFDQPAGICLDLPGNLCQRNILQPFVLPTDNIEGIRINPAGMWEAFLHLAEAVFSRLEEVLPFIKPGVSVLASAVKIAAGFLKGVVLIFTQILFAPQEGNHLKISDTPSVSCWLNVEKGSFVPHSGNRFLKLSVCDADHSAVTMWTFSDSPVLYPFDCYLLLAVGTSSFLCLLSLLVIVKEIAILFHQVIPNPIHHRLRQRTDFLHHLVHLFSDFVTPPLEGSFPNLLLIIPQDLNPVYPGTEERKRRVVFAPRPNQIGVLLRHVVCCVVYAKSGVQGSITGLFSLRKLRKQLLWFLKGAVQRFAIVAVNGQDQQITLGSG